MVLHRKSSVHVLFTGVLEYLLLFPIFLTIAIFTLHEDVRSLWLYTLPLVFAFAYLVASFLIRKKRIVSIMSIGAMSLILPMFIYFITSISIYIWPVFTVVYAFIIYRAFTYREYDYDDVFKVHYFWAVAFPLYFVGYFFYEHIELLNQYRVLFQTAGMITLISTLFLSNHSMLKRATYSKEKRPAISKSLTVKNRFFMVGMIAVIFLLANLHFIRDLLVMFRNVVGTVIMFFLTLFRTDGTPVSYDTPQVQDPVLPIGEPTEPSLLAQFFDKFAFYVGSVIACILIIVALYFISRKFKTVFAQVLTYLKSVIGRFVPSDDQTDGVNIYIDEKESLINFKKWVRNKTSHVKQLVSSVSDRRKSMKFLTNKEKIRFLYREIVINQMKSGLDYRKDLTPHELLSNLEKQQTEERQAFRKLDHLYNQARYSNQSIEERDLKGVEKLKIEQK